MVIIDLKFLGLIIEELINFSIKLLIIGEWNFFIKLKVKKGLFFLFLL